MKDLLAAKELNVSVSAVEGALAVFVAAKQLHAECVTLFHLHWTIAGQRRDGSENCREGRSLGSIRVGIIRVVNESFAVAPYLRSDIALSVRVSPARAHPRMRYQRHCATADSL